MTRHAAAVADIALHTSSAEAVVAAVVSIAPALGTVRIRAGDLRGKQVLTGGKNQHGYQREGCNLEVGTICFHGADWEIKNVL